MDYLHENFPLLWSMIDWVRWGFRPEGHDGQHAVAVLLSMGAIATVVVRAWMWDEGKVDTFLPRPHRLITRPVGRGVRWLWVKTLGRPKKPRPERPWIGLAWVEDSRLSNGGFHVRVCPRTQEVQKLNAPRGHDRPAHDATGWTDAASFDKAVTWGTMHAKVHPPMDVPGRMDSTGLNVYPLRFHDYSRSVPSEFQKPGVLHGLSIFDLIATHVSRIEESGVQINHLYLEPASFDQLIKQTGVDPKKEYGTNWFTITVHGRKMNIHKAYGSVPV